jgi:peptidoglycan/LPS O-acetylase OafA/YrhL
MSAHLKYHPDIDGLSALAVLRVVIFYPFPKALPGGFCGVDIFFVISGYLISGILYKKLSDGRFSFREFYARRIRRLSPSLIMVMLLCLAYGYLILFRYEYYQLGKHVAAGTFEKADHRNLPRRTTSSDTANPPWSEVTFIHFYTPGKGRKRAPK